MVIVTPSTVPQDGSTFGSAARVEPPRHGDARHHSRARRRRRRRSVVAGRHRCAHRDGSLHVVHGGWVHRLSVDLRPQAAQIAAGSCDNSFVVLPDGHRVTKDLVMDGSAP
jgi:hypothetical protein